MTVRDYEALSGCELVGWDTPFDLARAVKSELELESVRESVRINTEGFWVFLEAFEPGRTEREILAPCEEYFVSQGCGRWTMDMVLDGPNGARASGVQDRRHTPGRGERHAAALARDRRARWPLGRGLACDLRRRAERRDEADARRVRRSTTTSRPPRSARARPHATRIGRWRRASPSAASTSVT